MEDNVGERKRSGSRDSDGEGLLKAGYGQLSC